MSDTHLKVGDTAPEFTLKDTDGIQTSLSELLKTGKKVVLYFYPKDNTPGCTIQANDFTQYHDKFSMANTTVVGISKDSCGSHSRFRDKFKLKVLLLSDPDGAVHEAYGVFRSGILGIGKTLLAVQRSTFVIGTDGKILNAEYGVKAKGHAQWLLNKLQS